MWTFFFSRHSTHDWKDGWVSESRNAERKCKTCNIPQTILFTVVQVQLLCIHSHPKPHAAHGPQVGHPCDIQWQELIMKNCNSPIFSCCFSPIHLLSAASPGTCAISFYTCQKAATKAYFKKQLGERVTKGIIHINKPEIFSTNGLLSFFTLEENTGTEPQNVKTRGNQG